MKRKTHLTFLLMVALIFTGITVSYGINAFTLSEHGGTNVDILNEVNPNYYVLDGTCTKCHTIHASKNNALVGVAAGGSDNLLLAASTTALCESCHFTAGTAPEKPPKGPPNSYRGNPLPATGHGDAAVGGCVGCHDPHGVNDGSLVPTLLTKRDENVCYDCHKTAGAAATDIQTQFSANVVHPLNAATKHTNVEWTASMVAAHYNSGNRHGSCTDCHNPHECVNAAIPAGPSATKVGGDLSGTALAGVRGVTSAGSPIDTAQYEYEICFKCHSSYASPLPTGMPDIQAELNSTYRHPILGVGNDANLNTSALVNSWTPSSYMTCSDCHGATTGPAGVHGSSSLAAGSRGGILKTDGSVDDGGEVCYPCHNVSTYTGATKAATGYSRFTHPTNGKHVNATLNVFGIWCLNCHGGRPGAATGSMGSLQGGSIHGSNVHRMLTGANLVLISAGTGNPRTGASCTIDSSDATYGSCNAHSTKSWDANYAD